MCEDEGGPVMATRWSVEIQQNVCVSLLSDCMVAHKKGNVFFLRFGGRWACKAFEYRIK